MPNKNMLSNETAVKNAADRVYWKRQYTLKFLNTDPVFSKFKHSDFDFDHRDLFSIIPMLVDISEYVDKSDDEKEAYFNEEAKKIATAFMLTHDEKNPRLPDFKAVEPYLRRMYDELKVDNNIDWDNVNEIDKLFSSCALQQTVGTIPRDFARAFGTAFTVEEKRRIDNKVQKAAANQYILRNMLVKQYPEFTSKMTWGSIDVGNREYFVEQELAIAIADANDNTVVFDPEASEMSKNYFFGGDFQIEQISEVKYKDFYDEKDAAVNYLTVLSDMINKGSFNNTLMSGASKTTYTGASMLMINGQSVEDMIENEIAAGRTKDEAKLNVGMALRNAMTDGKSVVTWMKPILNEEGKITFKHQEFKVDQDKLNKIDRKQNYSLFRRALHALHIYRIPEKFPSNKERDRVQAEKMKDPDFQAALRAAEDRFIENYNIKGSKENDIELLHAYPHTSRIENVKDTQLSNDAPVNNAEVTEPVQETKIEEPVVEEPVVEVQSEETKVDAPKTEAPQNAAVKVEESNPLKERIVLDEFSAKTSDKDVSAKVEENDAPVVSNVKE